ncbi:MAG: dihydrofolate reductase family protein [Anaerolineae bacterium]
MRKIIVLAMMTLDGVMQAPGGPDEDRSGDFKYGGWVAPYFDEVYGEVMGRQMQPADLLLGRKTFEIFAGYWPTHEQEWPGINDVTKYVLSRTMQKANWHKTVFLRNLAEIEKVKNSEGLDLQVHGSSELVELLLAHDLVDELWLKFHPLTLGKGKKYLASGTIPAAFALTESTVTPSGVIIANYKRAGQVRTGTVGT